jgi:selenocysteine insertion sequence-binding protein 2
MWERGLAVASAPRTTFASAKRQQATPPPSTNQPWSCTVKPEHKTLLNPAPQDRPLAPAPKLDPWKRPAPTNITKPTIPTAVPTSQLPAKTKTPWNSDPAATPKVSPWGQLPIKISASPHIVSAAAPLPNPQPQPHLKNTTYAPLSLPQTNAANNKHSTTTTTSDHHKGMKRKPVLASPMNSPSGMSPIRMSATTPFLQSPSDFPALVASVPPGPAIRLLQKKPTRSTISNHSMTNQQLKDEPSQAVQPSKKDTKPFSGTAVTSGKSRPKKKKKQSTQNQRPLSELLHPKKETVIVDAHHSSATLAALFPTPSGTTAAAGEGAQFDLLRLYNEGNMSIQKGRQRLRPRKKKFTSLKKKVLEERLRKWKELQPEQEQINDPAAATVLDGSSSTDFTTVCLYGYCEHEELEDDDEYEEIVTNLQTMASKIGSTKRMFIPREGDYDEGAWPSFVDFEGSAAAAVECWNGLVLGGEELKCRPVRYVSHVADDATFLEDDMKWQEWCLSEDPSLETEDIRMKVAEQSDSVILTTVVILENALTEDDLDDEDCLEESLNDIRILASKFGQVDFIEIEKEASPPRLRIAYSGDARNAIAELNKLVIGGQQVVAKIASPCDEETTAGMGIGFFVRLKNVLTEDDLEDKDCLGESLNDVRELATEFGLVKDVVVDERDNSDISDAGGHAIRIYFFTIDEAKSGARGFDGMIIGGLTVSAVLCEGSDSKVDVARESASPANNDPKTLFSGDKIIPERFAECKRVPKIVNQEATRKYATVATDETIKPLLVEMLGELTRLQRRSVDDKNAKARRRIVMGLREVARGIRSHKVKMVVMANNLDEYGIIDETLQDIIDLSQTEGIPVFYDLSKRALGKALGKSIKVAVAGVQNADGAHSQFKKLTKYASALT